MPKDSVTNIGTRIALVTGANRGIGLAIVVGLAKHSDIKVLLGSRNLRGGEKAAAGIKGNVLAVALDLSDQAQLKKQYAAIVAAHGEVDILVNNAGVLEEGNLLEVSEEKFQSSLRINFLAAYDLIRLAMPGMVKRRYGRVVNVSSSWGSFADGLTGPAAYSVSKAGLNALTLSLSKGLPPNVKVNSICRGWVRTRMGGEGASLSPEAGADTAIWLATLPENGQNGGFFRERKMVEW
jgi:NAD(P)-dependent dehydrogenase (short-subunit alcohol dehydrogenase family)